MIVYDIGHSTRSLADFVAVLHAHGVTAIADVRAKPVSRRHPQYTREPLARALESAGIAYHWYPELGGLRPPSGASSPNDGWSDPALRAYADYTATPAFAAALAALESWAQEQPTAFLCAERDVRQCHRQLIADALVVRGWNVLHVVDEVVPPAAHTQTQFAVVDENGRITYPRPTASQRELFRDARQDRVATKSLPVRARKSSDRLGSG